MSDLLLAILCIFLSPVAVWMKKGIGNDFWINLILYILGAGCLGAIHGFWVIYRRDL